ncbi:MAG: hypothetical protein K2H52_03380 [Lachnospiraceae bacterium]|nr:hypothetical protein [Lachnospiraceae bacterium]
MWLKTDKILELMKRKGITEEMLPAICGVHCIRNNCFISPYRARKLSKILDVEVAEITEAIEK